MSGRKTSADKSDIESMIRAANLRVTNARVAVYQQLQQRTKPVSHSELAEELAVKGFDQATIFRTLQTFAEVSLVNLLRVAGIDRYELSSEEGGHATIHPHFLCRDCGDVTCLPPTGVAINAGRAWRQAVAAAEVQLVGRCPECTA